MPGVLAVPLRMKVQVGPDMIDRLIEELDLKAN